MKTITSVMLAAVFALGMVPLHSSASMTGQPIIERLAAGDGVDNRQCRMMEKQGKKLPGFCRP